MKTSGEKVFGRVFYDGECSFCVAVITWLKPLLRRHHFELEPLQTPWVQHGLVWARMSLWRK